VKNCVGAFHQPKGVLVDAALLATLPPRQLSNGMAEVVKMLLLFDPELFGRLERESPEDLLDELVLSSLRSKVRVVEQDERESGLRRVLNFGHTLGHGIESSYALQGLYHGECVALGMLPMCAPEVRARLRAVLEKLGLPTVCDADVETVLAAVSHDKKRAGDRIGYVYVSEVGRYEIRTATMEEFRQMVKGAWKE
jgi:3-dehydroquinate synthase